MKFLKWKFSTDMRAGKWRTFKNCKSRLSHNIELVSLIISKWFTNCRDLVVIVINLFHLHVTVHLIFLLYSISSLSFGNVLLPVDSCINYMPFCYLFRGKVSYNNEMYAPCSVFSRLEHKSYVRDKTKWSGLSTLFKRKLDCKRLQLNSTGSCYDTIRDVFFLF